MWVARHSSTGEPGSNWHSTLGPRHSAAVGCWHWPATAIALAMACSITSMRHCWRQRAGSNKRPSPPL
ncbi:MAG: hypothetical protein A3E25_23080 [Burkholderiales bacterium RIFCSPHIGHO2_12_FULL_69_20]|nr:MAG: hypothetical protein A3E25_23080 [Burkholderiales bacterium RIFCSPHIGHO2_12_FULL_69_20]